MTKARVLVSAPSMYQGVTFLPAIFGILRSACTSLEQQLFWLDPLFTYSADCESALEDYSDGFEVLALSCYEWNWDYQIELAALAKKRNPKLLVLAGGPQPDWQDLSFFARHPYIDAVIKGEPEEVFPKLLARWLSDGVVPQNIAGVWTRDNGNLEGSSRVVRASELPRSSPYLENRMVYERLLSRLDVARNPQLWVTWETNRGCPYQCVFCDWGSATYAKIREVELKRLKDELVWFSKNKIETVYITDANFGILERDVEIAKFAAETRLQTGFPKTIFFNPAKNNPKRLVEIYRILHAAKLLNYCLQNNLQSTQPEVLQVMRRIDVGPQKQIEFIRDIYETGINMGAALISGNPGESLEDFKDSLFTVLNWGIHSEIRVFPWALLPNAPAANAQFVEQNQIVTIERPTMRNAVGRDVALSKFSGTSKYLVSHSRLSRSEWVEQQLFTAFFLAFHCLGLTRFIAIYLHKSRGYSYREIYEGLYKNLFQKAYANQFSILSEHFTEYLMNPRAIINLDFSPALDVQIDPEAWLFLSFILDKQNFFKRVHSALALKNEIPELLDLIDFNSAMLIDPDYDPALGRSFFCSHDWISYFTIAEDPKILRLEPPKQEFSNWRTDQKGTGPYQEIPLQFSHLDSLNRLISYNRAVVGQKSSRHLRTYFQYASIIAATTSKIRPNVSDSVLII